MAGLPPAEFTMAELVVMAEGKRRETWEHTSTVLALIANVNSRDRRFKPSDFNPYYREPEPVTLDDWDILKKIGFKEVQ